MAKITESPNKQFNKVPENIQDAASDLAFLMEEIHEAQDDEKVLKSKIKDWAKKAYFKHNVSKGSPTHTFDICDNSIDEFIQLNFVDKYHLNAERYALLKKLLGEVTTELFTASYELRIDFKDVSKNDELGFLRELDKLSGKYGIELKVVDTFEVSPDFHNIRHEFPPSLNEKIDKILPIEVQITT